MKKTYNILLFLVASITLFSCDQENEIDPDFNFVGFEVVPDITVNENSTTEQTIGVFFSHNSGTERIVNLSVVESETSADETTYDFPKTITIPANSNKGEFTITISDINIDNVGESLSISINEIEGVFIGDDLNINLFRFCELDINNFIGDYTITEEGYGDYDTTITLDPEVENRIWVSNFWDWTNDLAYYDFNPEDGTITMPSQSIIMGDGETYECIGSGTYNGCTGTFHMEYQGDVDGTVHDFTPKS